MRDVGRIWDGMGRPWYHPGITLDPVRRRSDIPTTADTIQDALRLVPELWDSPGITLPQFGKENDWKSQKVITLPKCPKGDTVPANEKSHKPLRFMAFEVDITGLEPVTSSVSTQRLCIEHSQFPSIFPCCSVLWRRLEL